MKPVAILADTKPMLLAIGDKYEAEIAKRRGEDAATARLPP